MTTNTNILAAQITNILATIKSHDDEARGVTYVPLGRSEDQLRVTEAFEGVFAPFNADLDEYSVWGGWAGIDLEVGPCIQFGGEDYVDVKVFWDEDDEIIAIDCNSEEHHGLNEVVTAIMWSLPMDRVELD